MNVSSLAGLLIFRKWEGKAAAQTLAYFVPVLYILQTMSVYLHLNVNTECLRKRLSLFSSEDLHKEVCLCMHCRSIGIAHTGSAFCLAETDLLHQDIHKQQS